MAAAFTTNRKMYWRIVRRMLLGNRARLFVILLALGAGAAVTAALLNLQVDAQQRLTTEFTVFGPNVVISPKFGTQGENGKTLEQNAADLVPRTLGSRAIQVSPMLYDIVDVSLPGEGKSMPAVVVGGKKFGVLSVQVSPNSQSSRSESGPFCRVGAHLAEKLGGNLENTLRLSSEGRNESCRAVAGPVTGAAEDDQVWTDLPVVQRLANLPGRVSAIELTVPGTSSQIQSYVSNLQGHLPGLDVHPIRQFTEAQAKIYDRISGSLNLTVGIVLALTGLCVMAAMANVAVERRNDVGLMKAVGGATRRVLRLFLAEAAVLGVIGGVLGGALGILVSIYLGKAVFGLAARPRWVVYPLSVLLTLLVAIVAALPLRRLAGIRPASVFRGEA